MSRASAVIVERNERFAYAITDGPEAGLTFYASDRPWWLVGTTVTVEYHPQDQFARRAS